MSTMRLRSSKNTSTPPPTPPPQSPAAAAAAAPPPPPPPKTPSPSPQKAPSSGTPSSSWTGRLWGLLSSVSPIARKRPAEEVAPSAGAKRRRLSPPPAPPAEELTPSAGQNRWHLPPPPAASPSPSPSPRKRRLEVTEETEEISPKRRHLQSPPAEAPSEAASAPIFVQPNKHSKGTYHCDFSSSDEEDEEDETEQAPLYENEREESPRPIVTKYSKGTYHCDWSDSGSDLSDEEETTPVAVREAVNKARLRAERFKPKVPSGLRTLTRYSTSTVASDISPDRKEPPQISNVALGISPNKEPPQTPSFAFDISPTKNQPQPTLPVAFDISPTKNQPLQTPSVLLDISPNRKEPSPLPTPILDPSAPFEIPDPNWMAHRFGADVVDYIMDNWDAIGMPQLCEQERAYLVLPE